MPAARSVRPGNAALVAATIIAVLLCSRLTALAADDEFVTGGPLAGVRLPLFPTQHGEEPGHPGCLPGKNGKEGLAPERELYPGSVEHFRAYMFKYVPIRSFFDKQSQLANWVAPDIPHAGKAAVEQYAAPLYWARRHRLAVNTGKFLKPAPVIRCRAGAPVFNLDLGERGPGLYVVRVIGAVETRDIRPFRKSLFLRASVNDGPAGRNEVSTYRQRIGYCDEFYDVADIYFHAPEKRRYRMQLQVDAGSEVELLVHNISLDDVLAGTVRRAVKTRPAFPRKPGVKPTDSKYGEEERLARDAGIWNSFLPFNCQGGAFQAGGYGSIGGVMPGTDAMTPAQIEEKYGKWDYSRKPGLLLTNNKLRLEYTLDDLSHNRPLPDPYPLKDDGAGLTFASEKSPNEGRVWAPIAAAVSMRTRRYMQSFGRGAADWHNRGDVDAAHDAAVRLIRFALLFPTLDDANMLKAVVHDPAAHGRGDRCRRREMSGGVAIGHFGFQFRLAKTYDLLFDYIRGNELLARSVGRYVPEIKTPDDLVEFLDVYLIQVLAKRILRHQYRGDGREPATISEIAAILGDTRVTDSWMEWLFSCVFYYPRPLSGLPDYMVSATDRDGRSTIGSSSYVMGDSSAAKLAETLEFYIDNGGNPKYNLRDPERFPKSTTALWFPIRSRVAGMWTMRMGNVSGPDKNYLKAFRYLLGHDTTTGWRWTRDPRFAFIIRHYGKRNEWTDRQWAEIDKAAAKVRRAPWMDNRSRILPGYAAMLETGLEHDDFRFRRSVMLRIGTGAGHAHQDTLDMQIHAHGLPMTVDAGQRPGYSRPGDRVTRVHNTVEVNGANWGSAEVGPSNSWVGVLSDMEGAHYLRAQVARGGPVRLARRQVALINVDEGKGSEQLGPEAWGMQLQGLPKGVVTPNSYVFDVFRVDGGGVHTYCFHSNVNDPAGELGDYQPKTNAANIRKVGKAAGIEAQTAARYLSAFSGDRWFGTAPDTFQATFHLQKKRLRKEPARRGIDLAGTESSFLARAFDSEAPDKSIRLHLFGVKDALVMKGDLNCTRWKYLIPNVFVQRRGEGNGLQLQSAFAAVIEPYAGKPFIESVRLLPAEDGGRGAARPVVVEVKTTNGRTDVCFADGDPVAVRTIGDPQFALRMSGEFGFYSVDADGLRQASLTGGTVLAGPHVEIKLAEGERLGVITKVDYAHLKAWINRPWPAWEGDRIVELKTLPLDDPQAWQTGYTVTSVDPDGNGAELTFLRSADFYRSQVKSVDAAAGTVTGALPVPINAAGFRRGWTASDDSLSRTWRVTEARGRTFTLDGKVSASAPGAVLRLWEYGVGDQLRQKTYASLRRIEKGVYELAADVDVELVFKGGAAKKISVADLAKNGGKMTIRSGR